MLTNKEIANVFNQLSSYMELHKENAYRIKSYQNAYIQLRKTSAPIAEMTDAQIGKIRGIGKSSVSKIREVINTGKLKRLEVYKAKTPVGVQEMMGIKGFGAKKVRVIWKELGAETLGEVLYACNENRLITLKGFGTKTQADLKKKIEYFQQSKGKYHFATLEQEAAAVKNRIQGVVPNITLALVGAMRRNKPIVECLEFLVANDVDLTQLWHPKTGLTQTGEKNGNLTAQTDNGVKVIFYTCQKDEWGSKMFKYSGSRDFLAAFVKHFEGVDFRGLASEKAVFEKVNLPFIPPSLRENATYLQKAITGNLPNLLTTADIKGIVHAHSTYSDGLHTLQQMATYTRQQGFEYLVITDHSKSAFYANGLKPKRVLEQMAEIDQLNQTLAPFKIFKGIESDILSNGNLDYEEAILKQFDVIIASVHSNLKMDKAKATTRLLKAIENPYTTILGHPTGRLLLARAGYSIDYEAIIQACAKHHVAIELNANPHRLDLDWRWIQYAIDLGVKIAINPDAHTKENIHHIRYGVKAAQKGGLTAKDCLNALGLVEFEEFLANRIRNRTYL